MSAFKKRTTNTKAINGTKTSLQNGLLITSTGNPSLDHILGGGMPIGSILLIEEDRYVTYSKVLNKYFLAEGIYSMQSVFYASLDETPEDFLKKLPKPVTNAQSLEDKQMPGANPIQTADDDMRIAWRYNELPKVNSEQSASAASIGHHFNLTEQIDSETLEKAEILTWNGVNDGSVSAKIPSFTESNYGHLLQSLSKLLKMNKFSNTQDSSEDKALLRVCISSLGSPLWYDEDFKLNFLKFLTILRSMIKNASAVCFLTIPLNLIKILDDKLPAQVRNLVDYSFELESFAGSDKETNPVFKEYNGIFHIRRLCAVNALAAFNPDTTDLAFKLRRKKFTIEKLHLPPELQEPSDPQQPLVDIVPTVSCGGAGGGKKNLLDF